MYNSLVICLIFVVLLVSSCSVVKQNGYYQTKRYKTKSISLKQKTNKHNVKKYKTNHEVSKEIGKHAETASSSHTFEAVAKTINKHVDTSVQGHKVTFYKDILQATKKQSVADDKPLSLRTLKKNSASIKEHLESHPQNTTEPQPTTHWGAIVGFVCSILGFLVAGLLMGICAIVFGTIALNKIREQPEKYSGKGLAIAAVVIGIIVLLLTLLVLIALAATI